MNEIVELTKKWKENKAEILEMLKNIPLPELKEVSELIRLAIIRREPKSQQKNEKVLFNPHEHFERYNGGWTKRVIGLDKSKTNGYSILGDFMPSFDKMEYYIIGALYLDCDIAGSRKNQVRNYTLFTLNQNAEMNIISTAKGRNWAIDLWEEIDNYLLGGDND